MNNRNLYSIDSLEEMYFLNKLSIFSNLKSYISVFKIVNSIFPKNLVTYFFYKKSLKLLFK